MHITPKPPRSINEDAVHASRHTPEPQLAGPNSSQSFAHMFKQLTREVDHGERVVGAALRGNPYADDSRGMIALQAGVYRYVEAVELCTKLVDRATGAVRTTLQNQ